MTEDVRAMTESQVPRYCERFDVVRAAIAARITAAMLLSATWIGVAGCAHVTDRAWHLLGAGTVDRWTETVHAAIVELRRALDAFSISLPSGVWEMPR